MPRSVKLACSDAISFLESLPDSSVDLIVTDPAYNGMNRHLSLGKGRIVGKYKSRGDGEQWFEEFDDSPANYSMFLEQAARVLGKDRAMFLMFDAYSMLTLAPLVRDYFSVKNVITWDKVSLGMGHHFRRQSEFILFCTTGKAPLSRRDVSDVWRIKRIHKASYPTQKPIELFEAMIAASIGASASGDKVICDPFLGSGSSAVAAIRQGCSFVGSDIASASINVSKDRIQAYCAGKIDPIQAKDEINGQLQKPFWLDTRCADTSADILLVDDSETVFV